MKDQVKKTAITVLLQAAKRFLGKILKSNKDKNKDKKDDNG